MEVWRPRRLVVYLRFAAGDPAGLASITISSNVRSGESGGGEEVGHAG